VTIFIGRFRRLCQFVHRPVDYGDRMSTPAIAMKDASEWRVEYNAVRPHSSLMERLSHRKWRELLGRYTYGTKEAE
jgi:hypothetical protein